MGPGMESAVVDWIRVGHDKAEWEALVPGHPASDAMLKLKN
jgi:hypothetical protein